MNNGKYELQAEMLVAHFIYTYFGITSLRSDEKTVDIQAPGE